MKITTLIENLAPEASGLCCEHGLSMLVETHGMRILFDTGATGAFLDNAEKLGVDLTRLDAVVVSHAHFDHSGGMPRFLGKLAENAPLYLGEGYFDGKYKDIDVEHKYIGTRFGEAELAAVGRGWQPVTDVTVLTEGVWLVRGFARRAAFEKLNPRFVLKDGAGWRTDPFEDEVALAVACKEGLVVIAGCSHCGVVNLTASVSEKLGLPVWGVVGGSHLIEADEERIDATIAAFKKMGLRRCWLSHCTGERAMERMAQAFGEAFAPNHTGDVICTEE